MGKTELKEEPGEAISKTLTATLIIDWKKEDIRIIKRKPKKFQVYEIPMDVTINLTVPKTKTYTVKADIVIPETKAKEILVEEL